MLPKYLSPILLSVRLSAAAWCTLAAAQNPASAPQPATQSPSAVPAQLPPAPGALPQAEPAKVPKPPKKIYTNDNLPSAPDGFSGDFRTINDCDRNCFEQVRQLASVSAGPTWKRDLLRSLDLVRKDANWQQYLRDLYDAHLRFCAIGDEKREELAQVADPRNVTSRELAVDDKYDAKYRQAQISLESLTARQHGLQQAFAINQFSLQFSQLQVSKVQNAPCAIERYTASGPSDADDP